MVRLVLFDIDGTLIHSGGAGEKAFGRVCEMEFKVPNGTEGLRFAGRTDPSIVRDFFMRNGIEPSDKNFQRFFNCYVFLLDHLLSQTAGRVLPGVPELISAMRSLENPPALGLLTGNIRLGAQIKLSYYKLWDHFQTGGFGDDHEDRNEIAAIARSRGMKFLNCNLSGEEILVVGDTPLDIACGKAIDARVLAVATGGFGAEELRAHGPHWTVQDLREVCAREVCA